MVDFRKKLDKGDLIKIIDPIKLYESLDRRSIAGPLRPAQSKILSDWHTERREDKDLIIKLHTGEGKTLIGLLILQSKLNEKKGSCIFICPNIYLVQQVVRDAKKFGIQYCTIEDDGSIPNDFIDGEKILITHVQKVFNGKTKFGLGNDYISVENIILDDSHACIDSIKDSFTINISRDHEMYGKLFKLFEDTLPEQGEGTFLEISNGDFNSFLPIPYWKWIEKSDEIIHTISQYKENKEIKFAWAFIKDNIKNYQGFISGQNIEISPNHILIEKFSSFKNASQRILMSATTQDDSFFIKGLGFELNAIKNPLSNPSQRWSGEKMLVIPSLIHESLDRDKIVNIFAKSNPQTYGIISLISSFNKAEQYSKLGALTPDTNQIANVVNHLKKGNFNRTIVFTNRYDGIDLPDEYCRILILDGKPFSHSLSDKYEEQNRMDSDSSNIRTAQKIEQGLGRSVRGEKDYCVIFILGADLIKFIKGSKTKRYFSQQTQKQIEIGMEIAQMAIDDIKEGTDAFEVIKSLMRQSLQRDEGWKGFYKEEMNKIELKNTNSKIYEILSLERKGAKMSNVGEYEKASEIIQKIIDDYCDNENEKAWYLQIKARYTYHFSKQESNTLQKSAFVKNNELLKPSDGITYKKVDFLNENRVKRINKWINNFGNFHELILSVNDVLSELEFGIESEKFEVAMKQLGLMLGFLSERPDKEFKKGPDNLWCGVSNEYFIFECKNEVNTDRQEISKHEAGQMNTHCGWFESQYTDSPVKRILIIPTKDLSYYANFTHEVEIMRRGKLKKLRESVKSFFKEFNSYQIDSISDEKIQELINLHKLDIESLKTEYSEKYFHKTMS